MLHRTWARWTRHDRVYLDRNCIFEPVQQDDPRRITRVAVAAVREAWRRNEPAVLEAHRINFSHLDPRVEELGRTELSRLLSELESDGPVFLVDAELAGLQRRGTSWAVRGDAIVIRNFSRSRRFVVVPAAARQAVAALRREEPMSDEPFVVALAPGETRVLSAGDVLGGQLSQN